jgi:electron transfer flavoprotein alpha subunit
MGLAKVWVYGEAAGDAAEGAPTRVATITLEILAKARAISDNVEVIFGGDATGVAATLGAHGAKAVLATGDLAGALPGPSVASAIAAAIASEGAPDLFMFGTTYDGRDVAARLSVKLDTPVITNIADLEVDGPSVVGIEPVFGGTINVKTKFAGDKAGIVIVRPKSFAAEEAGGAAAAVKAISIPDLGATGTARIKERHVEESSGPKLDEAAVVVSGGRGLGEASKYEMVEQLAKLLKGAAGASRAIVDAGWVPYSHQVGQTGKVVKPTLYVACGISGATQHLVGMKGSKNIIAINKDAEAPIFGVADLGIVGDVHKVLPKLIEALQARS